MLAAKGHDSDGDSDADVSGSLNMSGQLLQCLGDVYIGMCWTPHGISASDAVCKLPAADTYVGRVRHCVIIARQSLSFAQVHM